MQFSEEWKSLFPISLQHSPPLLLSEPSLGPLCFNPVPETLTTVLSSPSQFSPLLLPPPHVSLPKFIENTTLYDDSGPVLLTTSNAISSSFGPQHYGDSSCSLLHNRFEPLHCPNDWVIVFFPTGSNLDSIGFVVLTVKDAAISTVDFGIHDTVFTSSVKFDHQFIRLAAFSLDDFDSRGRIGFLVGCSMYAAHWFSVSISGRGSDSEKPVLVHMGSKFSNSCAVAYACWNPHMPGECVILLENGALSLCDMYSSCFKGKTMSVAWEKIDESAEAGWFSCEFSWHPRILVVANAKAIFMVDFRSEKCQPRCLLKIEMLGMFDIIEKEQFVAFTKAGGDGFFFTVASTHWLLLCDIRKPLMPVLRWAHNLHKPCYMSVLPLSELRSYALNQKYAEISEMGSAVILGSFRNNEFNIFCYGGPTSATTHSLSISKFSGSFYAWGLPSELSLSGRYCGCGNCLMEGEFVKDDLPEWIEWQQNKELVLGFFMLNKDLSFSLSGPGEHGGFTLVRLMSSGKLETQQYSASWKMARTGTAHHETTPYSKDPLLCRMGDEEYKFTKIFRYLELEYLFSHLNTNLPILLFSKFTNTDGTGSTNKCSDEFQNFISEKLKSFGCVPPISDLSEADIFRDLSMPTSLYEIVSRLMWIGLPMRLLEVAFSPNKKAPLEFPQIPNQSQAPPFFVRTASHHGIKKSSNITQGSGFVGPAVPLHPLLVLSEISKRGESFITKVNNYSPEKSFALKCKPVMCLAKDLGVPSSRNKLDKDHAVSLGDDKDETWDASSNPSSLFLYEPSAFASEFPLDGGEVSMNFSEERGTLISKVTKSKDGKAEASKLFDDLCPVELKFDSDCQTFDDKELNSYQFLKKQFSQWQHGFLPYQNLFERLAV